jgi:hypothetical protein
MVRKSGIAMATPRLIVDQVTVRLECLETGVDFEPLGTGVLAACCLSLQECQRVTGFDPLPLVANACFEATNIANFSKNEHWRGYTKEDSITSEAQLPGAVNSRVGTPSLRRAN